MTARMISLAAAFALLAAGCGGGTRNEEETLPVVPLNVNLVKNPSFEEWNGLVPRDWKLVHIDGDGTLMNRFGPSADEKFSGSYSFFLQGAYNMNKWMALTQRHPVLPGHRIWYGGQLKSKALVKNRGQTSRANLYIRFYDKDGARVKDRSWADSETFPLIGNLDWSKRGRRIDVPQRARTVEIGLVCQLTGWIYFDDIELVLEEPVPWRVAETKYVDFHWLEERPFPAGAIERQKKYVEKAVEALGLDPQPENKISYYFYPSDEAFHRLKGGELGPAHSRARYATHELHTTNPYDDHEIIHLLLEPLGVPPFGLAEGAVFYLIGSWEGGRNLHMMAKELLAEQRLPAFFHIVDRQEMERVGMSVAVPGWSSFCIWLIDRYGAESFMRLYVETDDVKSAGPLRLAFKKIYNREFEEMDREWRLWVLRYQPKT